MRTTESFGPIQVFPFSIDRHLLSLLSRFIYVLRLSQFFSLVFRSSSLVSIRLRSPIVGSLSTQFLFLLPSILLLASFTSRFFPLIYRIFYLVLPHLHFPSPSRLSSRCHYYFIAFFLSLPSYFISLLLSSLGIIFFN